MTAFSAGSVGLDIIAKVTLDQSAVSAAANQARQTMQQAVNVMAGAQGGFTASGGGSGFAGGGGGGPSFGPGSAFGPGPFITNLPTGFSTGGIGGSGPRTSMGAVGTSFPGGAYFDQGLRPISGFFGASPNGPSFSGTGDWRAGVNAQADMANLYAMGDANRNEIRSAQQEGMNAHNSSLYRERLSARGEMADVYAMGDANREASRTGRIAGGLERNNLLARERMSARGEMADVYALGDTSRRQVMVDRAMELRDEGAEAQRQISRESDAVDSTWSSQGRGTGSRFGIGKYIAAHIAFGGAGAAGHAYAANVSYERDMARNLNNPQGQFEAYQSYYQARTAAITSIPWVGGPAAALFDIYASSRGEGTADQKRMQQDIDLNQRVSDLGVASMKNLRNARIGIANQYDPISREMEQESVRYQDERDAQVEMRNARREQIHKDIADTARDRLKSSGFHGSLEEFTAFLEKNPENQARLQSVNNRSKMDDTIDQLHQLNLDNINFRRTLETMTIGAQTSILTSTAGGQFMAAKMTGINLQNDTEIATARRNWANTGSWQAYQHYQDTMGQAGARYDVGVRENQLTQLDLEARAREVTASSDAGMLGAQGREHDARLKVLQARADTAGAAYKDRLGQMAAGRGQSDDFKVIEAANAAAQQDLSSENVGFARQRTGNLNRITASDVGLKYQMQAAVQFSNRQFGAARTSREIAGIEENTLGIMAGIAGVTDHETRSRMAGNLESSLKLQEYRVQHKYDVGYAEQRDVYKTIKEGYTNPVGSLDTSAVVRAIEVLIRQVQTLGQGTGMPLLTPN